MRFLKSLSRQLLYTEIQAIGIYEAEVCFFKLTHHHELSLYQSVLTEERQHRGELERLLSKYIYENTSEESVWVFMMVKLSLYSGRLIGFLFSLLPGFLRRKVHELGEKQASEIYLSACGMGFSKEVDQFLRRASEQELNHALLFSKRLRLD